MVRSALLVCLTLVWGVGLIHTREIGAQDIVRLQAGVVKITATEGNKTKVGTGFIVQLNPDIVYIVTAAHVVSGDAQPRVQFFTQQDVQVLAHVKHAEGGDEVTGMALLTIRGKESIPSGLAALPLASASRVLGAEDIMVIGHPRGGGDWAVLKGSITSRQGRYLRVDANIDEGNSGGPIMLAGQVVGLLGGVTRYGQGVTVSSVREYIEGLQIAIPEATPSMARVLPTPSILIEPERSESSPTEQGANSSASPQPATMPYLAYGSWTLRNAIDDGGHDWSNSVLKFTSQQPVPEGLKLRGSFTWRLNNELVGTEEVTGYYLARTRQLTFEGESVGESKELAVGSYSAFLSADDRRLTDGHWGSTAQEREAGTPGRWEASR